MSDPVKKDVGEWANKTYKENDVVHKADNLEHNYLVGEDHERKYGALSAGAGYSESDWGTPNQIGGTNTVSLIHVDGELDTDIADGGFHQDILKGESTTQIGGSSVWGLNVPLPLAKAEGKGYELQGRIQSDLPYAEGFGIDGKGSILKGKAYGGVDEDSIGLAAKSAVAEAEGSNIVPIPFTDTDLKLTGGLSAGSIGGEAKIGRETKLDLRAIFGFKIGVKFE